MPQPFKAGEVFDRTRALYNDLFGDVLDDETILPYFKIAYDDLRLELEDNNIPYTNATSDPITIVQGITSIGNPAEIDSPTLPDDLVEIIEMYERVAGSGSNYVKMTRRNFLPKTDILTAYLEVWTWQKQHINFLGATGNVQVKIDYVSDALVNVVDENTQLPLFNSRPFLSFRTAALCAEFIGENESRAASLNTQATRTIETLENIGVKNQQSMPVRRRPFRSRSRGRSWIGSYR